MAHPNEDPERETFAASGRGDIGALRNQYFAESMRLHYPGPSPLAGDHDGVAPGDGVLWPDPRAVGGTFRTELHDVVANDDHAVALFTAGVERADRRLEDRIVEVFHIRDGKAAEAWTYPADLHASDEFWS